MHRIGIPAAAMVFNIKLRINFAALSLTTLPLTYSSQLLSHWVHISTSVWAASMVNIARSPSTGTVTKLLSYNSCTLSRTQPNKAILGTIVFPANNVHGLRKREKYVAFSFVDRVA